MSSDKLLYTDSCTFEDHCDLIEKYGGQVYEGDNIEIHHIQIVPFGVKVDGMIEDELKRIKGCYELGRVYAFDLVIQAIRFGQIPEDKEKFIVFENDFTKEDGKYFLTI